jgi:hypothetical protein
MAIFRKTRSKSIKKVGAPYRCRKLPKGCQSEGKGIKANKLYLIQRMPKMNLKIEKKGESALEEWHMSVPNCASNFN